MNVMTKRRLFFGAKKGRCAKLYLRRTFSNIFLTLTDLKNKVIICKTSGSSGIKGSKRRKKVPYALEVILKVMSSFFKLHKINAVQIVLKMRVNAFLYAVLRELSHYNITVVRFTVRRSIAFNGTKGRKLRRL